MTQLFIKTQIDFKNRIDALDYIATEMEKENTVAPSYRAALHLREKHYPTGIQLAHCGIAIPHCEAEHAKKPSLFLIRPNTPVLFEQADDAQEIPISLIIALIITDPKAQLKLLKTLFSKMQDSELINQLTTLPEKEMRQVFNAHVFNVSL